MEKEENCYCTSTLTSNKTETLAKCGAARNMPKQQDLPVLQTKITLPNDKMIEKFQQPRTD
jgi:hypothetical protein